MGKFSLQGYIELPFSLPLETKQETPSCKLAHTVMAALDEHIIATRKEDGCLNFDITIDQSHRDRLYVNERFTDRAAFEAHQKNTAERVWGHLTKSFKRVYETTEEEY